MSNTSANSGISMEQIKAFIAAWYRALDLHLPIEEVYSFLADQNLNMQFPDGDIRDRQSFEVWYDRVINLFFDEDHTVVSLDANITGDTAVLDIVVTWQTSSWEPPAARSKRISLNATQQ